MNTKASPILPSVESIKDDIATLSATIQAATYQLLCLVGELDRCDGWSDSLDPDGFRSCAHWLSWRTGLGLGAARQYVRVARALPELPRLSAAFSRGELSYSKVRALTRIATAANEDSLLAWALAGSAAQVEGLVRSFRRADRLTENAQAEAREESRRLSAHFDADGMLVLRGRLAPEQGALLLKALEVSANDVDPAPPRAAAGPTSSAGDGSAEPFPVSSPAAGATGQQRLADALGRLAERALAADAAAASPSAADRFHVVVHVDAEVLANPDADGRCELEDGPAIAPQTARRLACDATVSPLFHGPRGELLPGRKRRVISAPLRRALKARDGTRCAFPGCSCRGRDAHHVKSWAGGGPTELANLLALCRRHHTLVHEGGFGIQARPDSSFGFFKPDGTPLPQAPPARAVTGDPASVLLSRWVSDGADPGPDSGQPTGAGERFDYRWAVDDLQTQAVNPSQ
jgi:hypothetical protein